MNWQEAIDKIYAKELTVARRSRGKLPYTVNEGGMFDDWSSKNVCWWTNGFYAGLLWQLYSYRPADIFRTVAEETEEKLDENFLLADGMDHDSGFKWLLTAGANYQLTQNPKSKNRFLLAANDLAGRFNPAGFLRAWNDSTGDNAGWAIIDCMMNLPLLYRASELTHDPRFYKIALCHAESAQRHFVREDGSCCHIAVFDPESGEFLHSLGGQGIAQGSSWTRGQGWALYGFLLSYLHTGRHDFLETAERVARYFMAHIPENGLIPVDYCQDKDCPFEDDTAAAIAACGLLELHRTTKKPEYRAAAERLLLVLYERRCDLSDERDNLLTHCSAAYHEKEHNFAIVYGDYYFVEAILKILGRGLFVW